MCIKNKTFGKETMLRIRSAGGRCWNTYSVRIAHWGGANQPIPTFLTKNPLNAVRHGAEWSVSRSRAKTRSRPPVNFSPYSCCRYDLIYRTVKLKHSFLAPSLDSIDFTPPFYLRSLSDVRITDYTHDYITLLPMFVLT